MKIPQSLLAFLFFSAFYGVLIMATEIDVKNLRALNVEVRVATVGHILTQRRATVKEAVEVLKQGQGELAFNDPRHGAFKVLAEFRAPEAVDQLLRMIELKDSHNLIIFENRDITLGDYYPAAGVIVKIGKPAMRSTIWELTKESTPQRRENLCWVIGAIEGKKVGRWMIEEQIAELEEQLKQAKAKRLDPRPIEEQIERLRAAVPVLEKLFPTVKKKEKQATLMN